MAMTFEEFYGTMRIGTEKDKLDLSIDDSVEPKEIRVFDDSCWVKLNLWSTHLTYSVPMGASEPTFRVLRDAAEYLYTYHYLTECVE